MASYWYSTKPQRGRGFRIILMPHGSSHLVNNTDLSKTQHRRNKTEEVVWNQYEPKQESKLNQAKLDFLLCLVKYSEAKDESLERTAITEQYWRSGWKPACRRSPCRSLWPHTVDNAVDLQQTFWYLSWAHMSYFKVETAMRAKPKDRGCISVSLRVVCLQL